MTILGSCGHVLHDGDGEAGLGYDILVKAVTCEGGRCVDRRIVCRACLRLLERDNQVLATEEHARAYLAHEDRMSADVSVPFVAPSRLQ